MQCRAVVSLSDTTWMAMSAAKHHIVFNLFFSTHLLFPVLVKEKEAFTGLTAVPNTKIINLWFYDVLNVIFL